MKNKQLPLRIAMAYGIYRTRKDGPDSATAEHFKAKFSREIGIKFLGVWDTVGALGIPLDLPKTVNLHFYEFHDTKLSKIVANAYQSIAVDEHRIDYGVCLWEPEAESRQVLEQRWFAGAHCDVGGGYRDRRLSDLTLRWMQDKAAATGLAINPIDVDAAAYRGVLTDSYSEFSKDSTQERTRAIIALFVERSSGTKSSILRCRRDARRIGSTNLRTTASRCLTPNDTVI